MSESPWRRVGLWWHKQACSWPMGCTAQEIMHPSDLAPFTQLCLCPVDCQTLLSAQLTVRTSHPRVCLYASSASLLPLCSCLTIHLDQCYYSTWHYMGMPASLLHTASSPASNWSLGSSPPCCCFCWLSRTVALGLCKSLSRISRQSYLHYAAAHSLMCLPRGTMHELFPLLFIKRRNKLPPGGLRLCCSLTPETLSTCSKQISWGISCAVIPNSATWWFPLQCPPPLQRPWLGFQLEWNLRALSTSSKSTLPQLLPMLRACQQGTAHSF